MNPPARTFLSDVMELRRRVRLHIQVDAVTLGAHVERQTVVRLLNETLATELVCILRGKRGHSMALAMGADAIAVRLLDHVDQKRRHVQQLAHRITELGGAANLDPVGLSLRSQGDDVSPTGWLGLLKDDLLAERIVESTYCEIVRYLADEDPATRHLLDEIVAAEKGHIRGMTALLGGKLTAAEFEDFLAVLTRDDRAPSELDI